MFYWCYTPVVQHNRKQIFPRKTGKLVKKLTWSYWSQQSGSGTCSDKICQTKMKKKWDISSGSFSSTWWCPKLSSKVYLFLCIEIFVCAEAKLPAGRQKRILCWRTSQRRSNTGGVELSSHSTSRKTKLHLQGASRMLDIIYGESKQKWVSGKSSLSATTAAEKKENCT